MAVVLIFQRRYVMAVVSLAFQSDDIYRAHRDREELIAEILKENPCFELMLAKYHTLTEHEKICAGRVIIGTATARSSQYQHGTASLLLREARMTVYQEAGSLPDEWIRFSPFVQNELRLNPATTAKYLRGMLGFPKCVEDNQVQGLSLYDEYQIRIHVDAVPDFLRKLKAFHRGRI